MKHGTVSICTYISIVCLTSRFLYLVRMRKYLVRCIFYAEVLLHVGYSSYLLRILSCFN